MVLMNSDKQMTKKRKFIREGIFNAEINNFLMRELAEDGYRFDLVLLTVLVNKHSYAAVLTFARRQHARR